MRVLRSLYCLSAILAAAALAGQQPVQAWANWRGPNGDGTSSTAKPPLSWSEDAGLRWRVAVPGEGCSSPIVLGDRIYVTTAIPTDRDGKAEADAAPPAGNRRGGRGGRGGSAAPTKVHEFAVLAFARKDGAEIWRKVVKEAVPHEGTHPTGSLASASPLTDGERLYAFFGSRGLYCLDLAGEVLWSAEFGRMRVAGTFGEGSSPALYGDTLVVVWDHEGESFLVALDKQTGKERWRTPRDEKTTWDTPIVVDVDGKAQIIATGTKASRGYDLKSGAVVWSCSGMTQNCIPTPIHKDGVVWLMSGYRGASLQAIQLSGAKGDLTGGDKVVWSYGKDTSYTPSALLAGGMLFFMKGNNGVLTCLDAATGKPHYEGLKVDGLRTVYSSPVSADGRVYITSREGVTKVIALDKEYKELASNQLDDTFDGTMALVDDEIYLRGRKQLYCIGGK